VIFWLRRGFAPIARKIWFDSLSIYVFPVSDFYDTDDEHFVMNFIEYSIDAATESILLFAGKFQRLRWARVVGQTVDGFNDALHILLREGIEVSRYRLLNSQLISCHGVLVP
jgi:hypothetical protein